MARKLTKQHKDTSKWWLLPIFLAGVFFRFYNNTAVALWHDEAFSALYVRDYSWNEMMYRIGLDVHPPLYYWILRLWTQVFGFSLLSLRSLSILFGVLTIWAAYIFVKKAFKNQKLAVLAALFIAINPFQIQYALEARMYTLGTLLILLSSYYLLKALESGKLKDWTIYGLLVTSCFYTHYYLIFSCAAQGIYVIYWLIKHRKFSFKLADSQALRGAWAYLLTLVLFTPWLKTFLVQRARVDKQYWIPPMDRWSIPSTLWKMIFGGQGIRHLVLIIATIAALFFLIVFIRRIKAEEKWLIIFSLIVPFLASILLSLQTAIYLDRYFVFASLFFTILIAIVLNEIPSPSGKTVTVSIFVVVIIFAFFKNWYDMDVKNLFFDRSENKKPGMAAAAKIVNDRAISSDHIYVGSSFVYFTYRYYNQTGIAPKLISSAPLETIPHFSGTALLNPDDLVLTDNIFNHSELKKDDNVWLVWTTGFGSSKPNVPGNWKNIGEWSYTDTPGFKGDIYVTEYHIN